jgi:hypothetical protein
MEYLLILGATILAAAAVYWHFRSGKSERQPVYHFRCAHCGQKLRYGSGSQGRKVVCPRCLRTCNLPKLTNNAALDTRPPVSYQARRL